MAYASDGPCNILHPKCKETKAHEAISFYASLSSHA